MSTWFTCTYVLSCDFQYMYVCVCVCVYVCVCMCVCVHTYINLFCISVPPPNVTVTAPNNYTVGQRITIHCVATIVRGVTSTVNLLWSDNYALRTINNVIPTTVNNSQVYTDSYGTPQLRTLDEGRVIRCRALINIIRRPTSDVGNTTLNVTGE